MNRYARESVTPLIWIALSCAAGTISAPWFIRSPNRMPRPLGYPQFETAGPTYTDVQSVLVQPAQVAVVEAPEAPSPSDLRPYDWDPMPQSTDRTAVRRLEQFAVAPQPANVAPPAAELIDLDPSISEAPPRSKREAAGGSESEIMPPRARVEETMPDDLETELPPSTKRSPMIVPVPALKGAWPRPVALFHQLEELAKEIPDAADWASGVITEIENLERRRSLSEPGIEAALARLHAAAEEARKLASPQLASRERSLRLRAGYALVRRLTLWDAVYAIESAGPQRSDTNSFSPAALAEEITRVESLFHATDAATSRYWSNYLRLNELKTLTKLRGRPSADQRKLARDTLRRIHSTQLTEEQCRFLAGEPFSKLESTLRDLAQETIDLSRLLETVEKHEATHGTAEAAELAAAYQTIRWSYDKRYLAVAHLLNDNYRNANVRVAINEKLINRFLPESQISAEAVQDNIRGAQVQGHSEAVTNLRVVLIPDRLRWRLGLEARGEVASATESVKGPARFWNDGLGEFRSRKVVTVDREGLKTDGAQTSATAESFLKDFETNYDAIPLFGAFARNIARQQYESEQPAARYEIEERISQKAGAKLDEEVARRLVQAEAEYQKRLLDPLLKLNLDPTPVDMETTSDRLIVRYRLAGPNQTAAYTPRPQAPGDSMLSVQLHETVMNNTLENLKLDGRKVDLRTLYIEMVSRFGGKDAAGVQVPEDLPENVEVHFAEQESVRVRCEDGRVRLSIRLAALVHEGETKWRNIEVHGYYKPSDDQQEANLVRDGNIELAGEKLRFADQVALRGIFGKVLSRNRTLAIVNKQLLLRKELSDLQVNQFVIQDGWIGVAIGPPHVRQITPIKATPRENPEVSRRPIRGLFDRR